MLIYYILLIKIDRKLKRMKNQNKLSISVADNFFLYPI